MSNFEFTCNFTDDNVKTNIHYIFEKFGVPPSIVEIGTYEGRTAFYISETYSHVVEKMQIYCIDPHDDRFIDMITDMKVIKNTFLNNLSKCSNKNIEYIPKSSNDGLIDLITRGTKTQFIYIDGGHSASIVLRDLILANELLEVGGVMLCDDTIWKDPEYLNSPNMSPRMAVESYIMCNWDKIEILNLPNCRQTGFVKLKN